MTRIKITISIYGDLLDPEVVSKVTELNPSSFGYKGDAIPNRKEGVVRRETFWEYSSGFIESLFLDDIASLFVERFSPNEKSLMEYIEDKKLKSKIYFIIEVVNENKPSIYLDRTFIDLVVKLNGEVDIDLYLLKE